jgi:hypothetical protein
MIVTRAHLLRQPLVLSRCWASEASQPNDLARPGVPLVRSPYPPSRCRFAFLFRHSSQSSPSRSPCDTYSVRRCRSCGTCRPRAERNRGGALPFGCSVRANAAPMKWTQGGDGNAPRAGFARGLLPARGVHGCIDCIDGGEGSRWTSCGVASTRDGRIEWDFEARATRPGAYSTFL